MPKLTKEMAKQVKKAESGFAVVPDGVYEAKLLKVTPSEKPGPSGSHYWNWEFILEGNEAHDGSHQFTTTSLSEKALFKFNEVFAAFGVPPDTDTDELYGKKVRLKLTSRTIQTGARQGELGNDVLKVLPLADESEDEGSEEIPF
jgi:hypothetical protein